jgi:tRNA (guanine37-N1)-methyltransferase
MIQIDVLTIFPEQLKNFLSEGIPSRAVKKELIKINIHNLRDWADKSDNHKSVDDRPFGGGAGMVLMVEPVDKALKEIRREDVLSYVIVTTPGGQKLTQKLLREFESKAREKDVQYILICGHYEGFDERIMEHFVDYDISLGDFVLSGGEIPVLAIIDGLARLVPGVLGNDTSTMTESFENGLLDFPQYTRPAVYNDWIVPDILLNGHHKKIAEWRQQQSVRKTREKRPDIII